MIIIVHWVTVLQFISPFIFLFSYSEIEEEKYLDPKQIIIALTSLNGYHIFSSSRVIVGGNLIFK